MPYPYISQLELEAAVGAIKLRRGTDDDNNGVADTEVVQGLIADASAKVAGYLRGIYDLDAVAANTPREVKRLTLQVARAYLYERNPEHYRRDWQPIMEQADKELMALRMGKTRLDVVGTPEPAANTGGANGTIENGVETDTPNPFFLGGTGIF